MDIRTLIAEAMRRQGLNPGAAAGAYATGPGVVNTPYATVPPVTATRGVEQDVQSQNPQDILRKLTGFRPTSNPEVALRNWQEFVGTQRQPSMWAQVAPGTPTLGSLQLTEQARQAREAERHDRAQLAETRRAAEAQLAEVIRANRAREVQTGATATPETRPRSMDALRAEATATGALALGARFRHNLQAAKNVGEPEDPMFTATDAIRRGLSDPNFRYELDLNEVDLYDLLDSFTVTNMGVQLPVFVQKMAERQPRKMHDFFGDPTDQVDMGSVDPLFRLLQAVVSTRTLDDSLAQPITPTYTPTSARAPGGFNIIDLFKETAP